MQAYIRHKKGGEHLIQRRRAGGNFIFVPAAIANIILNTTVGVENISEISADFHFEIQKTI